MIKELIRLSNHLDAKGLRKEADYLDSIIRKIATEAQDATGHGEDMVAAYQNKIEGDPAFADFQAPGTALAIHALPLSHNAGAFLVVKPNPPPNSFPDRGDQFLTNDEAQGVWELLDDKGVDKLYNGTVIKTLDKGGGAYVVHVIPPYATISQEGRDARREGYDVGTAVATPDSSGA